MTEIINERPPNFDAIVKVFPMAARMSVIFAYGEKIYVPSGNPLPPELLAHETVHCKRQMVLGVEEWWKRYLEDPVFRYYEEMLAHRAEYKYLALSAPSRQGRRGALKQTAKKLSAPLYGRMVSEAEARKALEAE